MKLILCAAALCIFQCCSVTGYEGRMEVEPKDGKCVADNGDLYAPGESWFDNDRCERLNCGDPKAEDGKFLITIAGCGKASLSPDLAEKCHLEAGTGPYPDCCPHKIVCNEE